MLMMPLGPQLMRIFQIEPHEFSFLVSAYTLAAGISGFLGTFWLDRVDRKSALIGLYTLFTIGTIACALAPSYYWLLIARTLTGAFGGIMSSLTLMIVGDVTPNEKRGSAIGFVMASFSVASVFGVPFGLHLANLYSWHMPFFVLAGISSIFVALAFFSIPPVRAHLNPLLKRDLSPAAILKDVASDPNQKRALLFTFLLTVGHFSIVPFISPSMVANVGFTEHDLTWIYFIGGMATIFTSPYIGKLTDRIGRSTVFIWGAALSCIPIWAITHLGATPIYFALFVTTCFFISSGARFIPASSISTSVVLPSHRGTFMSLNSCVQQLSSGAAAYVSGLIVSRASDGRILNYNLVGYLAIGATLLSLLVVKRIKSRELLEA
jgi:predicted MFS family arabinose efflux permease